MKTQSLILFANPSSVHVKQWTALMGNELPAQIWHAESAILPGALSSERSFPLAARLPRMLRYAVAGLMARVRLGSAKGVLVHGHNASGYGLMAALSGKPYLITVYGTEVYSMAKKSFAYRWLLTRILNGAAGISTSSLQMKNHLNAALPQLAGKVSHFSWGVDTNVFAPGAVSNLTTAMNPLAGIDGCERPLFFVNRRITPHYLTQEVLEGFLAYKSSGGKGTLALLKGDAFPGYFAEVEKRSEGVKSVSIIKDHLDAGAMAALLDTADVFVSVPISDSLSSAVLEGMACGTFAVLSDIDAYSELCAQGAMPFLTKASAAGEFAAMFDEVSRIAPQERERRAAESRKAVLGNYSSDNARIAMRRFYAQHMGGNAQC